MTMYSEYRNFFKPENDELIVFTFVTEEKTTCAYKFNLSSICDFQNSTFKKVLSYILKDEYEDRKAWNLEQIEKRLSDSHAYLKNAKKNLDTFQAMTEEKKKAADPVFVKLVNAVMKENKNHEILKNAYVQNNMVYAMNPYIGIQFTKETAAENNISYNTEDSAKYPNNTKRLFDCDGYIKISVPDLKVYGKKSTKTENLYVLENRSVINAYYLYTVCNALKTEEIYVNPFDCFKPVHIISDNVHVIICGIRAYDRADYKPGYVYTYQIEKNRRTENRVLIGETELKHVNAFDTYEIEISDESETIATFKGMTEKECIEKYNKAIKEYPLQKNKKYNVFMAKNNHIYLKETLSEKRNNSMYDYLKENVFMPVIIPANTRETETEETEENTDNNTLYYISGMDTFKRNENSITINMHEFMERFSNEYDLLYKADIKGIRKYDSEIISGERMLKSHNNLICKIAEYRHDYFISDREIAALYNTCRAYGLRC